MSDENTINKTESENSASREITFDKFLDLIKQATNLAEAKAVFQIFTLIKKGFSGDFNKEQVDIIFNTIKDWKSIDFLAIKLISEEKNGKLSSFAKQLTGRIRFHLIQELKYPLSTNSTTTTRDEIFDWIKNSFQSIPADIKEKTEPEINTPENLPAFYSLEKFVRMAFVCLSNNSKEDFSVEAIDHLLTEYLSKKGKKYKLSKISYVNSVIKAVSSKTTYAAVEHILISSAPFKNLAIEAKESEDDLWRKYQSLQGKISQLETNEKSLKTRLDESEQKNEELNRQFDAKTQALEEWKNENKNLDQHWQEITKQQLAKQANDTKRKLQNEITEIRLSLENHPPDVEITLLLLQRVEKILEAMT